VQDGVGPAGVQFCDMPDLTGAVGKFMVGQLALVAQFEAELVSEPTKVALAAAKALLPRFARSLRNCSAWRCPHLRGVARGTR
jgi:DNA invertase Pin-like site-specific DNA recombinase